jgi:hemoglobin-like flavoprotein
MIFKFKEGDDFRNNISYHMHAKATVERLDMAVCLLGPDVECLEDDLRELGERHLSYGVKAYNLPSMARALVGAIEHVLKDDFSAADKKGWTAVLRFLVENMATGMKGTTN